MALKPDRDLVNCDITWFLNQAAVAGKIAVIKSSQPTGGASGVGIGATAGECAVPTGTPASGTLPLGLLVNAFVSVDQTVQHRNFNKPTQVLGEPATLLRNGWVVTDQIDSSLPTPGQAAYLGASGLATTGQVNSIPTIGQFLTSKDSNGFAKLYIKLA